MSSQLRGYRPWTNEEEAKLVEALVNMVNSGAYKADNGFKAGYLLHLEQVMNQALPNSGLSGKPHIESKIRVMRKDWQIVYDLINGSNTSGFGYDTVTQSVVAEPEVWDAYIKVHKGAKKWKKKKFPYYEDLCIVFGKDRATGSDARDFLEIEEEVNNEQETQQLDDDDDTDDIVESSQIPRSHTSVQQEETSKNKNKKRKSREDPMIEVFKDAVKELSSKISKGVDREEEFDKRRSMITLEISNMQSLTRLEIFKACEKIRNDVEKVKMFWDLKDEDKEHYVRYILEQ